VALTEILIKRTGIDPDCGVVTLREQKTTFVPITQVSPELTWQLVNPKVQTTRGGVPAAQPHQSIPLLAPVRCTQALAALHRLTEAKTKYLSNTYNKLVIL
jgi:hypothetical protein